METVSTISNDRELPYSIRMTFLLTCDLAKDSYYLEDRKNSMNFHDAGTLG